MRRALIGVAVAITTVACAGPGRREPIAVHGGVDEPAARPAGSASFTEVRSPAAFCTALAHRPRKPPAYADVEPVEAGYAPADPQEDLGRPPGCITDRPAWQPGDEWNGVAVGTSSGPFDEVRILSIVDERDASGCALFVRRGTAWFVSLDAVNTCVDDQRWYESVDGSFAVHDRRLVIDASEGHDPCGCDDDLWVGSTQITVCGVTPTGAPACAGPFAITVTGADNTIRTWELVGATLRLGPWIYGTDTTHADVQLVAPQDGGGLAEVYRLGF